MYVRAHFPPSSTLLTVVHLAGPISTRLRANGARHRSRKCGQWPSCTMLLWRLILLSPVPLLPASKSQAQAGIKPLIIVNAVHEMISQEQRQALWQAQLSPLQPPVSTQSTLFPENRWTQKSGQQQHNPQQLLIQPSDGSSSSTKPHQ